MTGNSAHMDVTCVTVDCHEIERLFGLGATLAWEEEFPPEIAAQYRDVVLRDVEGNEFCLGAGEMP